MQRGIVDEMFELINTNRLTPAGVVSVFYNACLDCEDEGGGKGDACFVVCPIAKDYRARLREVWGNAKHKEMEG